MTQGDPLSHTIFNVEVDAVVRHWMMVMVEGAEEQSECRQEGRHHNTLFYADNGMVALSDPQWLQCWAAMGTGRTTYRRSGEQGSDCGSSIYVPTMTSRSSR